jgi:galactose mutarotase-like enzyme
VPTWDRNWGCRVDIDGTSRGWALAVLQNRSLRVSVLVGKGCDVVEVLYKPLDLDITPRTGRGLRRREEVLSAPWSEVGSFLDQYEGGWQEILPHGGPPGTHLGAAFPQHGESARIPWTVSVIEDLPDRVEILCTARLSIMPFHIEKRFSLSGSDSVLTMSSTVTNEAAVELSVMAGHHLAFGAPFIAPGSRIELPEGTSYSAHPESVFETGRRSDGTSGVWPNMTSSNGSPIDMREMPLWQTLSDLHYLKPAEGWYTLSTSDDSVRARVTWDLKTQPFLWFWQEFGAGKTYPWWGMEYLVGLEPWTSAPGTGLSDAVSSGTVPVLKSGESILTALSVQIEEGNQGK